MAKEARSFSVSEAYAVGDLCLYDGLLYAFVATHSAGAWDADDVNAVDSNVENDLERVVTGYERASADIVYAGKVEFEPELVSGTRYGYTFMNA